MPASGVSSEQMDSQWQQHGCHLGPWDRAEMMSAVGKARAALRDVSSPCGS